MDFRDMEDGRESGGKLSERGRGHAEKASPAAVERYIKGVHFPAQKEGLVSQARGNGAPQEVLNVLEKLSEKDYKSPIDIAREVPKAER